MNPPPKPVENQTQHPGAVYLPMDVRQALARGMELPRQTRGAALFADISGFTVLAEALTRSLGRRRGAEELPIMLNRVYDAVIAEVDRYGGSVIGFAGDSVTCWFDAQASELFGFDSVQPREGPLAGESEYAAARAVACGLAIQQAMQQFAHVNFPNIENASLAIKVSIASGRARRLRVGDPGMQRIETMAGETLSRMAVGESLAARGEVIVDQATCFLLVGMLDLGEVRSPDSGLDMTQTGGFISAATVRGGEGLAAREQFVLLKGLKAVVPSMPWPELPAGALDAQIVRPWVQPPVIERLEAGLGEFLTELRPASSLFMRFSGLEYDRDPAAGEKLDTLIRRVQAVAVNYGGIFVQLTIGEKGSYLYIAFGAPVAQDDAPRSACLAALELRGLPHEFSFIDSVQVGLSLGVMRTGAYGGHSRRTYGVLGDQVNLAARLMLLAEPGTILVSQAMQKSVPDFTWQSLPPVTVKGKTAPVEVTNLISRGDLFASRQSGVRSAWVGREKELAELRQAGGQAARSLLLCGAAGIGKTRLAHEALRRSRAGAGLSRTLSGGPQDLQNRIPYGAWRPVLFQLFEGQSWDAARNWFNDNLPQRLEQLGLLEDVLALGNPPALALPAQEDPAARKAALFDLLEEVFQAAAPLSIFLDNVQAMDSLSWDLVSRVAQQSESEEPLRLVLAARSEEAEDLPVQADRRVELAPLSEAESAALAASLLGLPPEAQRDAVHNLPPTLVSLLSRRASGNPFYIIQITMHLMEQGFLKCIGERVILSGAPAEIEQVLPDTIQGLLLARIDRLPPQSQLALKVAAVVGQNFHLEQLRSLLRGYSRLSVRELRAALDDLAARGLLAPLSQDEYRFESLMARETAYQTLAFAQRRELHARLARWLTQNQGAVSAARCAGSAQGCADPALLALHWELAEEPRRALPYLLQAGETARGLYALPEAIRYFRRALEILRMAKDDAQTARTLMKLGLTYHLTFDFEAARLAYEEGFALWQRAARASRRAQPGSAILKVDWPYLPLTFDPAQAGDLDTIGVVEQLFSGLVQVSPTLDIFPDLAERWELLEEGCKYIFHLRRDARWSDGQPLTAHDFAFAWGRVLDPDLPGRGFSDPSPAAGLLADIREIVASPDGRTLSVELAQPASYFLYLMASSAAFPVPRHKLEQLGAAWAEPENLVGCGAFQIARGPEGAPLWDADHLLVLERNPAYHGRFGGNLQRVELRGYESAEERLEQYVRGELEIFSFRGLRGNRDLVRQRFADEYLSVPSLNVTYAGFNLARPPFDDARLRRAFVMAVERAAHANIALNGFAFPASGGLLPPGMPGHTPGLALPFDPEAARRLLAEAGFPHGHGLPKIEMLAGEGNESILAFLAEQWQRNLGVSVEWQMLDYDAFMARMNGAESAHMFLNAWMPDYPDPDNYLRVCDALRWTRFESRVGAQDMASLLRDGAQSLASLQPLIENARRVTDQPARLEMYRQADRLLVEQALLMPFNYWRSHLLIKPGVSLFPTSPIRWWYWKDVIIGTSPQGIG